MIKSLLGMRLRLEIDRRKKKTMQTVMYVGDLHGDLDAIKNVEIWADEINAEAIVQVGDFGCLWFNDVDEYFNTRLSKRPWYTCGGNHDNYDNWRVSSPLYLNRFNSLELLPNVYWIKRGHCQEIGNRKHLFLGGATSPDKLQRIEGKTWWEYEMPTYQELRTFSEELDNEKPDVVITHDGPANIVKDMLGINWDSALSRDLQNILDNSTHKPKHWYFGHYHKFIQEQKEDTLFSCCGAHGEAFIRS